MQRHSSPKNPLRPTRKCKATQSLSNSKLGKNIFAHAACLCFPSLERPTLWGPQRTRRTSLARRRRRNGESLNMQRNTVQCAQKKRFSIIMIYFHRTEAASSVLKRSAVRQRSYVLSAAKKYEYVCLMLIWTFNISGSIKNYTLEDAEHLWRYLWSCVLIRSKEEAPDPSLDNSTVSFVAKR